jgi:hypothetical protein
MSTDPQRKNGIRPATTSVAIAFLTTAGDKAKLVDASVGRDRKFPVAIPATCTLCNPQKKMNENQFTFYEMEIGYHERLICGFYARKHTPNML